MEETMDFTALKHQLLLKSTRGGERETAFTNQLVACYHTLIKNHWKVIIPAASLPLCKAAWWTRGT